MRMTAQDGLTHPYCVQFRDPEAETVSASPVEDFNVNDNTKLSTSAYRDKIYELAVNWR